MAGPRRVTGAGGIVVRMLRLRLVGADLRTPDRPPTGLQRADGLTVDVEPDRVLEPTFARVPADVQPEVGREALG